MNNVLSKLVKVLKEEKETVTTRNFACWLVSVPFPLLLIVLVLLTSTSHISNAMKCFGPHNELVNKVIGIFCFFNGTYTIDGGYAGRYTGKETIEKHKYYQWIPCFILFHLLMVWIPKVLYENGEKNEMQNLSHYIRYGYFTLPEEEKKEKDENYCKDKSKGSKTISCSDETQIINRKEETTGNLMNTWINLQGINNNESNYDERGNEKLQISEANEPSKEEEKYEESIKLKLGDYAIDTSESREKKLDHLAKILSDRIYYQVNYYWTCNLLKYELMNFFVLILRIYLTNIFINHHYIDLGFNLDKIEKIFPKMTKCTFKKYGPSGSVESRDLVCLLEMNMLNEKILIFFWFLDVVFLFIFIVNFINRFFQVVFYRQKWFNKLFGPRVAKNDSDWYSGLYFWDWIFFVYFSANVDQPIFTALVSKMKIHLFPLKTENLDRLSLESLQSAIELETIASSFGSRRISEVASSSRYENLN